MERGRQQSDRTIAGGWAAPAAWTALILATQLALTARSSCGETVIWKNDSLADDPSSPLLKRLIKEDGAAECHHEKRR